MILLLCSCSAQKRLNRLLQGHPELIDSVNTELTIEKMIYEVDTIVMAGDTVTVALESLKHDTVFRVGRVTLKSTGGKISAYTKTDTLFQRDSVFFRMNIVVPGKVIKRSLHWWEITLLWTPIAVLLIILYNRTKAIGQKRAYL